MEKGVINLPTIKYLGKKHGGWFDLPIVAIAKMNCIGELLLAMDPEMQRVAYEQIHDDNNCLRAVQRLTDLIKGGDKNPVVLESLTKQLGIQYGYCDTRWAQHPLFQAVFLRYLREFFLIENGKASLEPIAISD